MSWRGILRRVREKVLAKNGEQRPATEGPDRRLLFSTEEAELNDVLATRYRNKKYFLTGGRLTGVQPGDEYCIMPTGAERADIERQLARAVVTEVRNDESNIELFPPFHGRVSGGLPAIPLSRNLPRYPVAVRPEPGTPDSIRKRLEGAIEASPFLRIFRKKKTRDDPESENVLAAVEIDGDRFRLKDSSGALCHDPESTHPYTIRDVISHLEDLARVRSVRGLTHEPYEDPDDAFLVRVGWGVVEGDSSRELQTYRPPLTPGQRLYVQVLNRGNESLYVSFFNLGIDASIRRISNEQAGALIRPGGDRVLGKDRGKLIGLELTWPDGVPRDGPRLDTVAIFITDKKCELDALGNARSAGQALSGRSRLNLLLDQCRSGEPRNLEAEDTARDIRYEVHFVDFLLTPGGG